jgi:hypothetical protein
MEVGLRVIAWSMAHSLLALRHPDGLLGASRDPRSLARAI